MPAEGDGGRGVAAVGAVEIDRREPRVGIRDQAEARPDVLGRPIIAMGRVSAEPKAAPAATAYLLLVARCHYLQRVTSRNYLLLLALNRDWIVRTVTIRPRFSGLPTSWLAYLVQDINRTRPKPATWLQRDSGS